MTVTPTGVAVPPQNIEAEESVLGAMLLAEPAVDAVLIDSRLEPDDFYRDSHRAIFRAIRSRRITGACRRHQNQLARAVKRARELAFLPYVSER